MSFIWREVVIYRPFDRIFVVECGGVRRRSEEECGGVKRRSEEE
jgi:hypothetical protein